MNKFIQKAVEYFKELDEQPEPSVRLTPVILWFMAPFMIGTIITYVWKTDHPLLVIFFTGLLIMILTAKPVFLHCVRKKDK